MCGLGEGFMGKRSLPAEGGGCESGGVMQMMCVHLCTRGGCTGDESVFSSITCVDRQEIVDVPGLAECEWVFLNYLLSLRAHFFPNCVQREGSLDDPARLPEKNLKSLRLTGRRVWTVQ